ncbi:MAG: acyl-CoA dehydrogenase [Glaciecola sp.]|jgi:acyl-CoA dehydrogenase
MGSACLIVREVYQPAVDPCEAVVPVVLPDAVRLGEPFTEEHQALRAMVAKVVATDLAPNATAWEIQGSFPGEVFTQLAALGLFGLSVPVTAGGQGADLWAELVLWQELGRTTSASVSQALATHALDGIGLLAEFGSTRSELAGAMAGTTLLAVAMEGGEVKAEATSTGWVLTGAADMVVNGLRADVILLAADTLDGAKVFVLPGDAAGLTRTRVDTTGLRAADIATLHLEAVSVDGADLLSSVPEAVAHLRDALWLRAALLVGEAGVVVDEAFAYAKQREVFGKPLDTFQVQQHRLVNLATAVEATHRLVHDVADKVVRGRARPDEVARLDLVARHLIADVADEALQLHGGYGYSQEYRVQRSWRDASFVRAADGGDDARRDRLAALLVALPREPERRVNDPQTRLPLYDSDQLAAQDKARAHFRGIRPQVDDWELAEDYPRTVFEDFGRAGLLGMMTAPEFGGSGPDAMQRMAVVEISHEMGSGGLVADVGAHSDLAMVYVNKAGTDEQRETYVRPGVAGTSIGSLGITEPAAGSNVAGITTTATRTDNGWLLNGTKHFITDGAWADWMVVTAKTSVNVEKPHRGISLFIVDLAAAGITRQRMKMLGWRASHTGEVAFSDVHLAPGALLGEEGSGFYQIMANFAWERLTLAWSGANSAEVLLREAIEVASNKSLGGRSLLQHDGWRHRLAELSGRIDQGRALTEHALRLYVGQADPQQQNRVTAMAKLMTQTLLVDVADMLLGTSGMQGQRRDAVYERHWRDARLGPIGGGTDEIMREILKKTYGMA